MIVVSGSHSTDMQSYSDCRSEIVTVVGCGWQGINPTLTARADDRPGVIEDARL